MKSTPHHPQLLDAKTYVADLTARIAQAKERVNLISLIFTDDASTHELIEEILKAAKRGVEVSIAADWFTYGEFGGYFSPLKRASKPSRVTSNLVRRLRRAGVHFTWLGTHRKLNPFSGTTHIKWSVVDSTAYVFGGTNLYEEGIESIDYMFRIDDGALADQISHQHHAIIRSGRLYPGYTSECELGYIYVDSGVRHESLIYDRVCSLAKEAEHILIVTQYCPSGTLARLLTGKSDVYYNQPNVVAYPANMLISYTQQRTGLRSLYGRAEYLHAKLMIFTMPDGKKVAMTGSHNFAHSGVRFGTREVALETANGDIIAQIEAFFETQVK